MGLEYWAGMCCAIVESDPALHFRKLEHRVGSTCAESVERLGLWRLSIEATVQSEYMRYRVFLSPKASTERLLRSNY